MNYRHLEVFYAVMTCGTVTEAARQLGVSQPSVTTTLKQAESKLGITLFQREAGRLVPTWEANVLFEEASRAHEALTSFRTQARRMLVGQGGHVRIAAIPSISLELLPDAVQRFRQQHPGFNFSISTLNTEEILRQLDARPGSFHLGLTLGLPEDAFIVADNIGQAELFVVVPAHWELPAGVEIDLASLRNRPYIGAFDGTALAAECATLFRDAEFEPEVVARIHTHHVAGRLVQRDIGFAILDAITVRALIHEPGADAVRILRLASRPTLPLTAIYSGQRALSNPMKLFIDAFRAAYADLSVTVEDQIP